MSVTPEMVKSLREKTGAGIMDCKKALLESEGNLDKAVEYLRKKGLATALKKTVRVTSEGLISSYIHAGGKIGVLVEVNCETDFVARTEEFQAFVKDITMHIAASNPLYVRKEEVPQSLIDTEKEVYRSQAMETKKPEPVIEKIVQGKLENYYRDICLLEQPFIKLPDKTVQTVLNELIAKIGENMSVRKFCRYQLGEGT